MSEKMKSINVVLTNIKNWVPSPNLIYLVIGVGYLGLIKAVHDSNVNSAQFVGSDNADLPNFTSSDETIKNDANLTEAE